MQHLVLPFSEICGSWTVHAMLTNVSTLMHISYIVETFKPVPKKMLPVTNTESDSMCPVSYHTYCHILILQVLDIKCSRQWIDIFCHITVEDLQPATMKHDIDKDSAVGFSVCTGETSTTLSEVSLLNYTHTYILL